MPATKRRRAGARGRLLALALATFWLMLLAVLGAHSVSANPLQQAIAADTTTPTNTDTPTNPPTATNTPHTRPNTPTPTDSTTPTVGGTATTEPTATTAPSGGGGGGNVNDPGSGSSQSTKVVLAQPTYGGGSDSSGAGFSVAAVGSNGLLFASVISCIVGILGIVVAVIAIQILRRDGYGPFLRALLLGKRANGAAKPKSAVAASGAANLRRAAWSTDDDDDYSAERDSYSGYGNRAPPSAPARRPSSPRNAPRGRNSRADW